MYKPKHNGLTWCVVDTRGNEVAICQSNADAWRKADLLNRDPLNRKEDVAHWSFRKAADEGRG